MYLIASGLQSALIQNKCNPNRAITILFNLAKVEATTTVY